MPVWTDEQFDRAEIAIRKVVRPATGTLTSTGRPPLGAAAKRRVTLQLDPDVIDKFREGGPGWQGADQRVVAESDKYLVINTCNYTDVTLTPQI